MSSGVPQCGPCAGGICGGKGKQTFDEGVWTNNPISVQILGICSALAVTNRLENSLVMGIALIFVCVGSNLFVSLLRDVTPRRIRMIAEVAIIATFVILFDRFLKAFYYDMSKMLGPYVGLIITNCIIMGRAEAFALQNPPVVSMLDGLANGLGYAAVLGIIGFFRELVGTGVVPGVQGVLSVVVAAFTAASSFAAVLGLVALVLAVALIIGLAAWKLRLLRRYAIFAAIAAPLAVIAVLASGKLPEAGEIGAFPVDLVGPIALAAAVTLVAGAAAIRRGKLVTYLVVLAAVLAVPALMLWRARAGVGLTDIVRLPDWYVPNQLMILAPGAFIALGFLIALFNVAKGPQPEEAP